MSGLRRMSEDRMSETLQGTGEANTGRWTKQEHELFLKGLKDYGKDWKQIGSLIKTRTVVQIRTHAQKYFLATRKQEDPSGGVIPPLKLTAQKKRSSSSSLTSAASTPRTKAKKKKSDSSSDMDVLEASNPATYDHEFNTANPAHHNLDNLDDAFLNTLMDNWSSESDEGTPISAQEYELFKSVPTVEEDDTSASSSPMGTPGMLANTGGRGKQQSQILHRHHANFHSVSAIPPPPAAPQPGQIHHNQQQHQYSPQASSQTYPYHSHQFHSISGYENAQYAAVNTRPVQQLPTAQPQPVPATFRQILDDVPPLAVTPTPEDSLIIDPLPAFDDAQLGRWMEAITE